MKNKDIIVFGIQAWDIEIGSNCKNIAITMAKNNRVLYVNQPLYRKSRFSERATEKVQKRLAVLRGERPEVEEIDSGFWVMNPRTLLESTNWLPRGWVFDRINRINNVRLARRIRMAVKQLEFKNYILFNDSSIFLGLHLKELLQPRVYVYYMRDFLTKNPFWRKHGVRIEPQLIRSADVVVNNSMLYTEYGLKYNPNSYMVGQGCEVAAYNDDLHQITIAPQLADLRHPVIGYVGFLSNRRLNIELLETLAEKRPEWTFVLVGPEDDDFSASRLHQMKNVIFTGSKNPESLPGWIKGFDVCLNPQRINDATIGNYPRKIDEYLAMGKPTVASNTKAMEYFREHTYLGETVDDYLILIERAIKEDNVKLREARKAFARSHTWENNVKAIFEAIRKIDPNLKN